MAQLDASVPVEEWTEVLKNGAFKQELGPEKYARLEWFIASPVSTASFGCIISAKAGDFEGFFDPCAGVHFDMWGRPQKGPTDENLKVPAYIFSEDRRTVKIDVTALPVPK